MRNDPQFNDEFAPAQVDERIEQLLQVPIPLQSSDASLVHDLRGLYQEDQLILARARARIFQDVLDENDVPFDTPFDVPLPAYEWHDPSINNTRVNSRGYTPTRQQPSRPQQARTLRVALLAAAVLAIVLVGSMASFAYFVYHGSNQTTVLGPSSTPGSTSTLTPATLLTSVLSRSPTYSSTMNGPDRGGWAEAGSATGGCTYSNGGYQVGESTTNQYTPCFSQLTGSNIAFQATMTMTSATNDGGGLIFRQIYRFHVSTGEYDLVTPNATQSYGADSAINVGASQRVVLTVIAIGSDIYLYANGDLLAHISDSSSSSGSLGLFAYDKINPTSAVFTNVKIWQL